jgi:hypothetical protein
MTQTQQAQGFVDISGNAMKILNTLASQSASFTYAISGPTLPDTVSIILSGCMNDGSVDLLNTYTTVAPTTVTPSLSKTYDFFTVTASWTNGLNVVVSVDAALTGIPATLPQLTGTIAFLASVPPASASANGVAGQFTWDSGFLYLCTATNTWKRVAIATW